MKKKIDEKWKATIDNVFKALRERDKEAYKKASAEYILSLKHNYDHKLHMLMRKVIKGNCNAAGHSYPWIVK